MVDLTLLLPTANARPDFTVRSESHTLQLRAGLLFKVRAAFDKRWAVQQLKHYAQHYHGVPEDTIYLITSQGNYPIYKRQ